MKKSTLRVIIILMSLLFINIEAANAGLIQKVRLLIHEEFPDNQHYYILMGFAVFGFLGYVIFAPVLINKQKWAWLNYYSYQPGKNDFQSKKTSVKKISEILQSAEYGKQVQS